MNQIKQLGDLGRKHYEKLLLILVLIGVGGAVYYLYGASQEEKRKLDEFVEGKRTRSNVKPVEPVNLTNFWEAEYILKNPPNLDLTTPHNLFNPVKWQKRPDGSLLKIQSVKDIGAYALTILEIRPLHMTIALDRPAGSGYWVVVTNAMENPRSRDYRITQFASLTSTNTRIFVLKDVSNPDEPESSQFKVELKDSGEVVAFTASQPYQKVQGYEADLRYDVEGKTFENVREGSPIRLSGENYNIVAIKPGEVLLSADSNDRRYTIKTNGAP